MKLQLDDSFAAMRSGAVSLYRELKGGGRGLKFEGQSLALDYGWSFTATAVPFACRGSFQDTSC